jgi:threonine/homoserine/homoserine lactone efflux protein
VGVAISTEGFFMTAAGVFISIIATLLVGAMSPGPSFVVVSRIAISRSRMDGLAAALGMGIAGVIFSILALAGLTALLTKFTWLYLVLKIGGGAYLVHIAINIWRSAGQPFEIAETDHGRSALARSFSTAFLTQLSNPKTIIVYASIFAALLPRAVPPALVVALPLGVFVVEAGWYAVVAVAFSTRHPRRLYLAAKRWIDRTAGAVMAGLGLRLILSGLSDR